MRVLYIIHDLTIGGAENLIYQSLPLFKKKGVKIDLLLVKNNQTSFAKDLKEQGITVHTLDVNNLLSLNVVLKLYRFLKENHFDIVHVHLFPILYQVPLVHKLLNKSFKLVYTEHSTFNKRRKYSFIKHFEKLIYSSYDSIISISPVVSTSLNDWLGGKTADKMVTINNGVDFNIFNNAESYNKNTLLKNDLNEDLLLMVARFTESKDHITVLLAFKKLLHKKSNVKLLFAGEGPTITKIKTKVNELNLNDKVFFLGSRNDIPRLLKTVNISIISSHWEGFGLSAIESLAAGIPVIASKTGGLIEILKELGVLFEKGNSTELSENIHLLLTNSELYDHISSRGVELAKTYDIQFYIDNHISLYKKLVQ